LVSSKLLLAGNRDGHRCHKVQRRCFETPIKIVKRITLFDPERDPATPLKNSKRAGILKFKF
jgi:hypothetical protein